MTAGSADISWVQDKRFSSCVSRVCALLCQAVFKLKHLAPFSPRMNPKFSFVILLSERTDARVEGKALGAEGGTVHPIFLIILSHHRSST